MLDPDLFPTAVYRLFDRVGALLYVGMGDARTRLLKHLRKQSWRAEVDPAATKVEWYGTRADAAAAECAAIQSENPKYNVAGRRPRTPGGTATSACPANLKPFTSRYYVGSKEIRERLGLGHNRVQQLINEPHWPAPYDEIAAGRLWLKEDIEGWISKHRPHLILPGR